MKDVTIADLFAKDGDRFSKFSATFDDQMLVDYSKNRITEETLAKLQDLAKECDLAGGSFFQRTVDGFEIAFDGPDMQRNPTQIRENYAAVSIQANEWNVLTQTIKQRIQRDQ